MITVSEGYVVREGGKVRLCADVKGLQESETIWFQTDAAQEKLLCRQSGECFVLGLLPYAMRNGQDIRYDGILSKRFVHGVNEYLIPSLAAAYGEYDRVTVCPAKYGTARRPALVRGTAMQLTDTEKAEALLQERVGDVLYPLTHLCVFCDRRTGMEKRREMLSQMAGVYELSQIVLEYNMGTLYSVGDREAAGFLELAGALALSGGLQIYFYDSDGALSSKETGRKEAKNLDIILCSFAGTEAMRIYLFDGKDGQSC